MFFRLDCSIKLSCSHCALFDFIMAFGNVGNISVDPVNEVLTLITNNNNAKRDTISISWNKINKFISRQKKKKNRRLLRDRLTCICRLRLPNGWWLG